MAGKILIEKCRETTWEVLNFMGDSEMNVRVNYETSCELVRELVTKFPSRSCQYGRHLVKSVHVDDANTKSRFENVIAAFVIRIYVNCKKYVATLPPKYVFLAGEFSAKNYSNFEIDKMK